MIISNNSDLYSYFSDLSRVNVMTIEQEKDLAAKLNVSRTEAALALYMAATSVYQSYFQEQSLTDKNMGRRYTTLEAALEREADFERAKSRLYRFFHSLHDWDHLRLLLQRYDHLSPKDKKDIPKKERTFVEVKRDEMDKLYNKFISANLRLVVRVAHKYRGRGLELDDLIEEGNQGLFRALDKFDVTKGYRFITYAMPWIRTKIQRAIYTLGTTFRLPDNYYHDLRKMKKAEESFVKTNSRWPTEQELAKKMRVKIKKVQKIKRMVSETEIVSLQDIATHGKVERTYEQVVGQPNILLEQRQEEAWTQAFREHLGVLHQQGLFSERDFNIIAKRFGLYNGGEKKSLEEVGKEYGISRERVRQIEKQALSELRELKSIQEFAVFVDAEVT